MKMKKKVDKIQGVKSNNFWNKRKRSNSLRKTHFNKEEGS